MVSGRCRGRYGRTTVKVTRSRQRTVVWSRQGEAQWRMNRIRHHFLRCCDATEMMCGWRRSKTLRITFNPLNFNRFLAGIKNGAMAPAAASAHRLDMIFSYIVYVELLGDANFTVGGSPRHTPTARGRIDPHGTQPLALSSPIRSSLVDSICSRVMRSTSFADPVCHTRKISVCSSIASEARPGAMKCACT